MNASESFESRTFSSFAEVKNFVLSELVEEDVTSSDVWEIAGQAFAFKLDAGVYVQTVSTRRFWQIVEEVMS